MSKQLAISAAISIFAMTAFVLSETPSDLPRAGFAGYPSAASAEAEAHGLGIRLPDLAAPHILSD